MEKKIPLNSLEKFMLAHESEFISYNSQICIEFYGDVKLEEFKQALLFSIKSIPLLRSKVKIGFFNFERTYLTDHSWNCDEVLEIKNEMLTQVELDQFCNRKFDLKKGPSFKFLLTKTLTNKNLLIFNVHHSLCDAAGQFHLLEEIFRTMENMPIRAGALSDKVFRYRNLWTFMGKKWFSKQLVENFKPLSKQRQYQMATLIDYPDRKERFVTSQTVYLSPEQQTIIREMCKKYEISITEYLTWCCFRAIDQSLRRRGDVKTPIMVYLPKTLRPLLKIRYSLQNILSTVLIVGKREEVYSEKFLGKVKHAIISHKMDKAAKFIFGSLMYCSLFRPKKLQEYFRRLDQDSTSITSSLLISAGLVPRSFTFPSGWMEISVWARGTMLKSPGIGVIFTGVQGAESITLEYLKDLTESSTIEHFKKDLITELLETNKFQ